MTTKDVEVIDKHGKRVRRDGILQDGDMLSTRMTMMDTTPVGLSAAAALAGAVKRVEQFDMKQHPQAQRYGTRDAASESAREARDAKVRDAWKQPTTTDATATEKVAVVGAPAPVEQLNAARAAAVAARDKRTSEAWRGLP